MSPLRDEVFERLYAEHAQALYGFLSYRTGDRVLAEDLLADTFERALRARGRFDRRKASEKTWLYAIALNLLRDQVRRRGSESKALERVAVGASAGSGGGIEQIADRDLVG
ncbi:MAG TPA: RNA polymerase sigma factor [Solirubrobacteraceae bacterium]|nr:RNA polymerase sigma factor [Solirubrobacteraceae bacterium]